MISAIPAEIAREVRARAGCCEKRRAARGCQSCRAGRRVVVGKVW